MDARDREQLQLIGSNLRRLRHLKGLEREDLRKALGLANSSSISHYELAMRELGVVDAIKLARALGVTLDELLLGHPDQADHDARARGEGAAKVVRLDERRKPRKKGS